MSEKPVKGLSIAKKETFEITLSELKILAPSEAKIKLEKFQIAEKLKDDDIVTIEQASAWIKVPKNIYDYFKKAGLLEAISNDDPKKLLEEMKETDEGLDNIIFQLETYKKLKDERSRKIKEILEGLDKNE